MENVGTIYDTIFYSYLLYVLGPFGIICDNLVYFSQLGIFGPRKIWQPWYF
jgi:hypothetical protein